MSLIQTRVFSEIVSVLVYYRICLFKQCIEQHDCCSTTRKSHFRGAQATFFLVQATGVRKCLHKQWSGRKPFPNPKTIPYHFKLNSQYTSYRALVTPVHPPFGQSAVRSENIPLICCPSISFWIKASCLFIAWSKTLGLIARDFPSSFFKCVHSVQ